MTQVRFEECDLSRASGTSSDADYRPKSGPRRLRPREPRGEPGAPEVRARLASGDLEIGVEHILFGVDPLFFVLALVLLVCGDRALIALSIAFVAADILRAR